MFLCLNKPANMILHSCDSKERDGHESPNLRVSKAVLLEEGILEAEMELKDQLHNHTSSSETNRHPDDCGRCIMYWTPVLGFLFLCAMCLVALGLKGIKLN
jgi:hypothetical protein